MAIHKIDGVDAVDGGSVIFHFPKKFVTLRANEAVTKGYWVAIDVSDTTNGLGSGVKHANSGDGDASTIFGVATASADAGANVRVQTAGKFGDIGAFVQADTAAGEGLVCSAVEGQATQGDTDPGDEFTDVGFALAADATGTDDSGTAVAANYAHVMIRDQGLF